MEEKCDNILTNDPIVNKKFINKSTDLFSEENTMLENNEETYSLKKENEDLKKEIDALKRHPFGYHSVSKNDDMFQYYSGLSEDMFEIIATLCSNVKFNYYLGWNVTCFSLNDWILMILIKLKLNLGHKDLAFRFNTRH